MQKMRVQSLVQEDLLEKEMATHSSIFVWEILRIEEPGGLTKGHKESDTTKRPSTYMGGQSLLN